MILNSFEFISEVIEKFNKSVVNIDTEEMEKNLHILKNTINLKEEDYNLFQIPN